QGDFAKALKCHLSAFKVNKKRGAKSSMQINLANIGISYEKQKKYSIALSYHLEALKISQEIQDRKSIAVNYGNAGEIYMLIAKTANDKLVEKNNLSLSIAYLKKAITLCNELDFKGPLIEFNEKLSEAYSITGNDLSALQAYKEYIVARDSVYTADLKSKIATIELNRELQLKEKEITLRNQQIQIKKLESKNKKNEKIILLFGISFLLAVISLMTLKFHARYRKHKTVLKEIAWQQSHEVRAPLAKILGLINLIADHNPTDPAYREMVNHLKSSAIELDEIIKKVVRQTKS
ncbi:MAG TPA: hypothetical protein VK476_07425, partial [Flavobacterium sp.]|nr:hypothetical protein [Flavobacterium sp.]